MTRLERDARRGGAGMWRPLAALAARGGTGARRASGGASPAPRRCRCCWRCSPATAAAGGAPGPAALRARGRGPRHRERNRERLRERRLRARPLGRAPGPVRAGRAAGQPDGRDRCRGLRVGRAAHRGGGAEAVAQELQALDPKFSIFGSYTDVTPRQFFNVQLDTEYRKQWDSLVLKLDVVERDPATGSEVIHWVTQFPYPMYSRDYVYVRRYSVDSDRNLMVLVSRAVEHPGIPEDPEHVRVRSYESHMVIRPHRGFDENGFDYLLTYSDNPQTVFPRYCLSWMVSSGMPEFLEKLHSAALKAKKMELELRDYLSPAKGPEPRGAAQHLEYAWENGWKTSGKRWENEIRKFGIQDFGIAEFGIQGFGIWEFGVQHRV
ncbi:stAR-related lipid transfer protein 7, mitochondrial [Camarhynchus parvulus]|uniref:stAR-related lipid transfer protein 7, mitochondrial n=1 Tax=Geospiza parvula TaxID=87175 RepID=UPI0012381195|nr:stAR-related lipid transfer protein 7, mitochondrial [Camarhynchus parvulus]